MIENIKNCPIGIFDSGIGGLTVANSIVQQLPNESTIYFGDTAHLPYGDKSSQTIRNYCEKIVEFLIAKQCKVIVIACNTASAVAYNYLKEHFTTPIISVIHPLIDEVARHQHSHVGVIATKTTIYSGIYQYLLQQNAPNTSISALPTPLLVPMIEEGFFDGKINESIIAQYLNDDQLQHIEALILGCTHYPLIKAQINAFYQGKIKIYTNEIVANTVSDFLTQHNLHAENNTPEHKFYVSDYTQSFAASAKLFYHSNIALEQISLSE